MDQRLEIEIERRRLDALTPLAENAHYMEKREFELLVDNIKRDGVLTSLPVVYDGDVPGEIISGNHRVKAALKAGVESADCLVIRTPLTPDQKIAIQLSHNSIKGKDDQNLLRELYSRIVSLDLKQYSWLTNDSFKISEIELTPLSFSKPTVEEVSLSFLSTDKDVFLSQAKRITELAEKKPVLLARVEDFDAFHRAVFGVRSKFGIINLALAVSVMAEMALERLEQLASETPEGGDGA